MSADPLPNEEITSGADVERLMLNDPARARELLASYRLLLGTDPEPSGESRAGFIPRTYLGDSRYFTLGLSTIDSNAGDIRPGELIALGASTGHGKSALGEHIALENALRHRVLFLSLEMDQELVEDRLLAKLMGGDIEAVALARESRNPDYFTAMEDLRRRDLLVVHPERSQRSLRALTLHAERVTADFVIIDYASKISHWEPGRPANAIINELWDWIQKTRTTTLLLAQTKRPGMPGGKRYRPTVHDFSDSREIENTATRALLLWRPFHGTRRDTIAELTLGKNRFGREFRAHVHWTGETGEFEPMTIEEERLAACCRRTAPKTDPH